MGSAWSTRTSRAHLAFMSTPAAAHSIWQNIAANIPRLACTHLLTFWFRAPSYRYKLNKHVEQTHVICESVERPRVGLCSPSPTPLPWNSKEQESCQSYKSWSSSSTSFLSILAKCAARPCVTTALFINILHSCWFNITPELQQQSRQSCCQVQGP